jgi:hypothetical protein
MGTGPFYRYALFMMNSDGTGSATQLTQPTGPNGNFDAYAASWSPDGSQIAFNCAFYPSIGQYYDDVSLCVMDAAGHSFRVMDTHLRIYPPAWLDNSTLVYGGNSHHTQCANWLCRLSLGSGLPFSYAVPAGGATYIDMPNVSNGALFYRVYSAGVGSYRMADLDPNGNVLSGYPNGAYPYHVQLANAAFDYYAVRPGGRDVILGTLGAQSYWSLLYNGAGGWSLIGFITLPDQVNDPNWNGVPESYSLVYIQRNSFAWVP